MTSPNSFLGGAQDRLLPASIPFRFFLTAAVFHVLAWITLFLAANQLAWYTGGPGRVLASLHLVTLGVFAMTAIGASYQLLPVVTRRPLLRDWPARLSFWLFLPGVLGLAWGMGAVSPLLMQGGAILVGAGLAVFGALTADNLRRAGSLPVVAAHGWGALAALVGFAGLGILLVWDMTGGFLANRATLALTHMVLASYGFMGLLVLGLGLVLIPMFALSRAAPKRLGWAQLALAGLALTAYFVGGISGAAPLRWLALLAGSMAIAVYFWTMRLVLAGRMRKRLGLSFLLIRASWGFLALSLGLGGLVLAGVGGPSLPALFGFTLIAGWLLTFLLGILQRILPFLASMHASGKSGLPPPLSSLTAEVPLRIHAVFHFAALVTCAGGILLDMTLLVQIGAALGVVGALAFLGFAVNVVLKLRLEQQTT